MVKCQERWKLTIGRIRTLLTLQESTQLAGMATLKFLTPVFFEMKASKKRRGLEAGSDQPSPQIRFSCSIGPILPVIVPFKHRTRSQHDKS